MNKNYTAIMFGVLFSSMILLRATMTSNPQNVQASPIITNNGTTVQAHTDNGFNNGYAKGKFDITHGQALNDTCLPKELACDQFHSGYVTAVNQYAYHCKLCVPNNATLLKMNETGSIPSGIVHAADGYTDGYNKGRSNTLNNHSFSDLCLSTRVYCDNYERGYITGWVEMHMASGTPFDKKLIKPNETA